MNSNTISQLKTQIFELEQSEKNYELLNTQYRQLQNEIAHIVEDRIRQESDYKQTIDNKERKINELRNENMCLQDELTNMYIFLMSNRKNKNKIIYNELNAMENNLNRKINECNFLTERLEEFNIVVTNLEKEKYSLEKNVKP